MITIYKTNTMKNAAQFVTDILKTVDTKNLSVMRTVIVPDRASLEAERALLNAVGGSFNIQVRTFRRLANEILPKLNYLSKQAGIMALTGIIQDVKDKLVCYRKGVETAGFVADMYDTISMMKYCKIPPSVLNRDDLPKGVAGKAHDIALLYDAYLNYSQDKFIDSADKLDLLCEQLPVSQMVTNGYFYLYDFDNLSKQELAIVEKLMLFSRGVTIACCASDNPQDSHLFLNDIFNGVCDLAKGQDNSVVCAESHTNKFTEQIGKHLFRYDNAKPMDAEGFLELYQGATRVQEVYALACRIQKYIRSGGRFRDVYVVTSDITKYTNAIATIFEEFEIPFFCDRQFVLSNHPYVRFVTDYISLCRNNGKLNFVLPFVKNYLFCGRFDQTAGVDEDVFHFENYCLKYNVSFDYSAFRLGKHETYFPNAERFREKFNMLFKDIVFPATATATEYIALVHTLVERSNLKEKNSALAEQQLALGMTFENKVTLQAQPKFEEVLHQAETILGERHLHLDDFLKLLTVAVSSVKISVIPVLNDCVVFANMAKARKHDIKFLALLGANYGAMPIVKTDCKLLSDRNLQDLNKATGLTIEPMISTENKRERFSLFQLLQEPTEKLYVSYAAADGVNALTPSQFVAELSRLFTRNGEPLAVTEESDEEVYTQKQAIAKIILNKRKLQDFQMVKMPSFEILLREFGSVAAQYEFVRDGAVTVQNGKEFYLSTSETSVSKITDFYHCPYRFFLQYGLRVKPREVAQLKAADLGNILHEVLENYVRNMGTDEDDQTTRISAEKCFTDAISNDFYRGMRTDVQLVGVLEQLKAESVQMCLEVKKQLKNSQFVNKGTEIEFGPNGTLPAVDVNYGEGKFLLIGKIDRVDVLDNKFIVLDYKSGARAAKYDEESLFIGHKLQLLVYVKAVQNAFGYQPVGFYYFNMHNEFTDIGKEDVYVYNGRTLNDLQVAFALDTTLEGSRRSRKLGLALRSDGNFDGLRCKGKLLSSEQIQNQTEYALKMIEKAGKLMLQGYAAVSPYEGCCSYCDYIDVCDFNDVLVCNPRKVGNSVTKDTIDEAVK